MKNFNNKSKLLLLVIAIVFFASCGSNPEKSANLLEEGVDYYYHAQYSKAYSLIKQAVEENPENFEAWFWLGNYYENLGKHNKAIEAYDKAISLNSDYADAFSNRANAKKHSGNLKGACADWKKAASLGKPNLDDDLKWCERNGY